MTAAGFTDVQVRSIREADARLNIWEGAIRSGKTVASLVRWLGHVAEMHGRSGQIIVTGATRESIARNVFGPLQDPTLLGPLAGQVRYTAGAPTATVMGETVHVIGASDSKAEPKVRGVTAKSLYCDEITVLPEGFFRQALGRLSVAGAKMFGSTNPGAPNHWLRRDFLLRASELDMATWHFQMEDNTFLDPTYVAMAKAEFTGLFYRRFIDGAWVAAKGAVFDVFDEDTHVVSEAPAVARLVAVGVDYGTTAPFAALMLAHLEDGRMCLTRELRNEPDGQGRKHTDADHLRRLADWLGEDRVQLIAVDPSAASFKEELRRARHPVLSRARDADNAVVDGIRTMSALLARERLVIHESCTGLVNELPGYSWDDKASEKGEDKPVKIDDHSIDASRYALHTSRSLWQAGLEARMSTPTRSTRPPARRATTRAGTGVPSRAGR